MNKIAGLIIILLIMASTICLASPLTDYSLGKVSINVNFGTPSLTSNNWSSTANLNPSYNVTAGMGFGFAGQYIYNDFKPKTPNGIREIRAQQINLLTNQVNKFGNISAFIGESKTQIIGDIAKNGIVAGLVCTVPIMPNTHAYATVSTGTYVDSYEMGIGYTFAQNIELNLDYRNANYKGLTSDDITVKGPYGGLVYNF
ncbi:hypothetical protein Ga0466249_003728 [Sporomusaceae bacterium BoRhaA]|uniref:outer membrane beta-barrel protein n=1 Tax=Pelorhabdus rhamnosifermentans TaxID=2772457 RepID=UPI001C06415C|nr:outer membrane beta-barrel protein [Pelorhabdus rhamnosifermentans]MBU2702594.1 hypothetical protein [Pelorhabdus rhamnosifermentans]